MKNNKARKLIFLTGPNGVGKTTLVQRLEEILPCNSETRYAGSMLAREVRSGSIVGREIAPYFDSGKVLPYDKVMKVVMYTPLGDTDLVLIEGMPRDGGQWRWILEKGILDSWNLDLRDIFLIELSHMSLDVVLQRSLDRKICSDCGASSKGGVCKLCGSSSWEFRELDIASLSRRWLAESRRFRDHAFQEVRDFFQGQRYLSLRNDNLEDSLKELEYFLEKKCQISLQRA